jgi:hypothetical protein
MAKARKQKLDKRGPLQRALDAERGPVIERAGVAEYQDTEPLVNAFAEAHGIYARNLRFVQNNGCTTIKRWETANLMSASQLAAIAHCIRLWDAAETSRGMVVDLDRVRAGESAGDGLRQQEALDDLARIKGYIPHPYFAVFENVVRFDEPAGYIGSRLAEASQREVARARTIVQFAADLIAQHERLSY